MEKSKFWRCMCLFFCVYSLKILFDERYEVTYLSNGRNSEVQALFLACGKLNRFKLNTTILNLDRLRDDLLRLKTSIIIITIVRVTIGEYSKNC